MAESAPRGRVAPPSPFATVPERAALTTSPQPAAAGEASPRPVATRDGAVVTAALAVLVLVVYGRVLFLGETFAEGDALTFQLPSFEFLGAALRAGRLPEWSDWVGVGFP